MSNMIAARYLAPKRIEAIELDVPGLAAGEALVQVEACGICGSDLNIVGGYHPRARPPLTPGHEICGRIVQIRSDQDVRFKVGDRVTAYPLISCGRCFVCRHGNPHVCRQLRLYGIDVDGGMAEFVKLPLHTLLKIPDTLPASVGALIEPLAVGIHAVSRAPVDSHATVAIIGAGTIGLVTAMAARLQAAGRILVSDVAPSRLELSRQLGFDTYEANDAAFQQAVLDATDGEGADVVFECTGAPSAALQMTNLVRCRGHIVVVGVFKKPSEVNLLATNFKELTLVGSRVYSLEDFGRAVEAAASLPLEKLITYRFFLRKAADAFDLLMSGGHVGKVVLDMSAPPIIRQER